jgi:hypothetical protein
VAGPASSSEKEIAEERYQLIPAQPLSTGSAVGPFEGYRFAPGQAIDDYIKKAADTQPQNKYEKQTKKIKGIQKNSPLFKIYQQHSTAFLLTQVIFWNGIGSAGCSMHLVQLLGLILPAVFRSQLRKQLEQRIEVSRLRLSAVDHSPAPFR